MPAVEHAVKRTVHKERHQLASRVKLGILEKKKDYRKRAAANHRKEAYISNLKTKAYLKNPEEFYFKMNSAKTAQNKKVDLGGELSKEQKKLLFAQDARYLTTRIQADAKASEKLKAEGATGMVSSSETRGKRTVFLEEGEDVDVAAVIQEVAPVAPVQTKALKRADAMESRKGKLQEVLDVIQMRNWLAKDKGKKTKVVAEDGRVSYKFQQVRKR